MSSGHRYRADGWCAEAQCFRHIADEPDFGSCPDTHGDGMAYRADVPPDKADAYRLQRLKVFPSVTQAARHEPVAMLRAIARILR